MAQARRRQQVGHVERFVEGLVASLMRTADAALLESEWQVDEFEFSTYPHAGGDEYRWLVRLVFVQRWGRRPAQPPAPLVTHGRTLRTALEAMRDELARSIRTVATTAPSYDE